MTLNKLKPLALGLMLGMGLLAAAAANCTDGDRAGRGVSGNVLRATLDNGLRVVIVHDTLAPMVTTQITYLAGGYQTPKGFPGTAHALEHMMFRDSKGMTGAQLNEMTGKMGGDNNAFTTNDATQYYFVAPAAYLDVLLHIEASRMRGAELSDEGLGAGEGRDRAGGLARHFRSGFPRVREGRGHPVCGHRLCRADPLGTRPSFDKTTSATLQKFYNDWYQPNNAIFVIVGDVDPAATLAQVKRCSAASPKASRPRARRSSWSRSSRRRSAAPRRMPPAPCSSSIACRA